MFCFCKENEENGEQEADNEVDEEEDEVGDDEEDEEEGDGNFRVFPSALPARWPGRFRAVIELQRAAAPSSGHSE